MSCATVLLSQAAGRGQATTGFLEWDPSIAIGDIVTTFGFLVAAIGLWFAYRQLRDAGKLRRAQFLLQATNSYFADRDVRELYYDIDYGRFEIQFDSQGEPTTFVRRGGDPQTFVCSTEERDLDRLLYTLDAIGRVVEIGAMEESDARIFAFQANRVFGDPSIKRLLQWLDGERGRFGGDVPVHEAGRALATESPEALSNSDAGR